MKREWFLIDDEGIHPLNMDDYSDDFWGRFDDVEDAPWPAFNQVVVNAEAPRVQEALSATGPPLGLSLEDVTESPEHWPGAVAIAQSGSLSVVGEPGTELDERVMALRWSEELFGSLGCDGAFFGYDPEAETLHLTVFRAGRAEFAWCDSVRPGPSYAMVFDEDGQCTEEDPRRFALRMLNMPESSPLLDRYRFVVTQLQELGLETVSPEMEELPIAAVLAVERCRQREKGTDG